MDTEQISTLIMNGICKNENDAYQVAFYKVDNEQAKIEICKNIEQENCNKFKINRFGWITEQGLLNTPDILLTRTSELTEEEKKALDNLPLKVYDVDELNLANKEIFDKQISLIELLMYEAKMQKYFKRAKDMIQNIEAKYKDSNYNNDELTDKLISEMLELLKDKDKVTYTHVTNVSKYVDTFIAGMPEDEKLPVDEITFLKNAALVHDIGKLMIPNQILKKESRLSNAEFTRMREHVGANAYLFNNELMKKYKDIALCHHERYDGRGYPNGLVADQIPKYARIIAVLDTFDAMTGDRGYVQPNKKTLNEVIEEIKKNAGTQFDPTFAGYFINGLEKDLELQEKLGGLQIVEGGINK